MTVSFWNGKATQLMRLTHDTYFSQTRHWNNRGRICAQLVLNLSLSEQGWYQTNVVFAFQKQIFQLLFKYTYIYILREKQCKSIWYYSTIYIYQWKIVQLCLIIWKGFSIIVGNNLLLNYLRQFIWTIARNFTEMAICGHRLRIICKEVKFVFVNEQFVVVCYALICLEFNWVFIYRCSKRNVLFALQPLILLAVN